MVTSYSRDSELSFVTPWAILLSKMTRLLWQYTRPVDRLEYLDLAFVGDDNSQGVFIYSVENAKYFLTQFSPPV